MPSLLSDLSLRPTTDLDLDFVIAAERHPDNCPFVGQWTRQRHASACSDPDHRHYILQTEQTSNWLQAAQQVSQPHPSQAQGQRVGYLIFQGFTDDHLNVQIRRLVVTQKGQGYGRLALRWAKYLAFEQWSTHRLWLDVKTHNPRAQHLYKSEGFVYEGTLRECVRVGDRFESLAVLSILRSEYVAFMQT